MRFFDLPAHLFCRRNLSPSKKKPGWVFSILSAGTALLTATGCGNPPPYALPMKMASIHHPYNPPSNAALPLPAAAPSAPDPLTAGGDPLTMDGMKDPLAADQNSLSKTNDALSSANGPRMPTDHSHWLSISEFQAHVNIRLNGTWYGEFYGPALRDITMKLLPGSNTITISYIPQTTQSWLAIHLTEGEHNPPIPDLITYKVPPLQDALLEDKSLKLTQRTQTLTFFAH